MYCVYICIVCTYVECVYICTNTHIYDKSKNYKNRVTVVEGGTGRGAGGRN